jgi:hypothetical protein
VNEAVYASNPVRGVVSHLHLVAPIFRHTGGGCDLFVSLCLKSGAKHGEQGVSFESMLALNFL